MLTFFVTLILDEHNLDLYQIALVFFHIDAFYMIVVVVVFYSSFGVSGVSVFVVVS